MFLFVFLLNNRENAIIELEKTSTLKLKLVIIIITMTRFYLDQKCDTLKRKKKLFIFTTFYL